MSDSNIFVDGEPLDISRLNEMRTQLTDLQAKVAAANATLASSASAKQYLAYPGSVNRSYTPKEEGQTASLKYNDAGFSAGGELPRITVTPIVSGGSPKNNLQYYVDNSTITNTTATLHFSCVGKFIGTVGFDFIAVGTK
jgi:hypothetical protein